MIDSGSLFEQFTDHVFSDLLLVGLLFFLSGELADLGRINGIRDRTGIVIHLTIFILEIAYFILLRVDLFMIFDEPLGLFEKGQSRILHVSLSFRRGLFGFVGDISSASGLWRSHTWATLIWLLNRHKI